MTSTPAENGNGQPTANQYEAFMREIVGNAVLSRQELFRQLMDPRRDYDAECGYPRTEEVTPQNYRELYERHPIAARTVEVLPMESWKVQPEVYEDEDPNTETEFEKAWKAVGNSLRGQSWYGAEEGNPIWDYLLRADILSGIGRYGVILLGLNDNLDLQQPAAGLTFAGTATVGTPEARKTANRKLNFIRVFDESQAVISRFQDDPRNPRYGQPEEYMITVADPRTGISSLAQVSTQTLYVHWTRIIHIADNLSSSEVFGSPRMTSVLNPLLDLRKLYGGSAEMYWRGAFPGLSLETHPQLGGDVEIDKDAIRKMMFDYRNGLQRDLLTMGMAAKTLAPQVVDPTPQITNQIESICIRIAVPKRVFMGSERGELASSQDDDAWNDRLQGRQKNYLTPRIVIPLVDRLIALGVLPAPRESYYVSWPDLGKQSPDERATIVQKRTAAMAQFVSGDVGQLMSPTDFLSRELDYTDEEAQSITESAAEHVAEKSQQDAERIQMMQEAMGTDQPQPGNPSEDQFPGNRPFPPQPSNNSEGVNND